MRKADPTTVTPIFIATKRLAEWLYAKQNPISETAVQLAFQVALVALANEASAFRRVKANLATPATKACAGKTWCVTGIGTVVIAKNRIWFPSMVRVTGGSRIGIAWQALIASIRENPKMPMATIQGRASRTRLKAKRAHRAAVPMD